MRGKLMLVTGLAVGYVLGSRAGRERYNQIARAADSFWHSRPVQHQMHQAGELARDKAPDVVDFVSDNVKRAMHKSRAKKRAARSRRSSPDSVSPQPASN
ncbi:hypothetical protein [Marisediminicola antarctica]|uniref:YtxH domain-containing protein n=1 Tax=Marisediminicola antarctica TaxID=674079 RepID=A0A7L5AF21_9MICO|nr:hypothetical protein [Marisediminicola antarctica]QHO68522.1 hypothetical protein BHD05_01615 [Marisediminicola antarctica]